MSAFVWFLVLPQLVSGSVCADAVEHQLSTWHAGSEVLKTAGGPVGGAVYRIATNELGVWITLHQPKGLFTTSVFLTNARETLRVDFGADCEPRWSSTRSPADLADAFTDEDLKAVLARHDRVVVYLWSPHLPLSVEGYAEIAAATSTAGFELVAVAHGAADPGFVRRAADEHGIPVEATRPMSSVELLFRDLAVHTPSILVFANGTASAPLPGYRNRAAYAAHLASVVHPEPIAPAAEK